MQADVILIEPPPLRGTRVGGGQGYWPPLVRPCEYNSRVGGGRGYWPHLVRPCE